MSGSQERWERVDSLVHRRIGSAAAGVVMDQHASPHVLLILTGAGVERVEWVGPLMAIDIYIY